MALIDLPIAAAFSCISTTLAYLLLLLVVRPYEHAYQNNIEFVLQFVYEAIMLGGVIMYIVSGAGLHPLPTPHRPILRMCLRTSGRSTRISEIRTKWPSAPTSSSRFCYACQCWWFCVAAATFAGRTGRVAKHCWERPRRGWGARSIVRRGRALRSGRVAMVGRGGGERDGGKYLRLGLHTV